MGLAGGAGGGTKLAAGEVAPSGVPQRAQNLNVAALSVLHDGHALGGALGDASLGAGRGGGLVGRGGGASSGIGAPQLMQEPTSVSFSALQRGQIIRSF
jgi:hypothetical protein